MLIITLFLGCIGTVRQNGGVDDEGFPKEFGTVNQANNPDSTLQKTTPKNKKPAPKAATTVIVQTTTLPIPQQTSVEPTTTTLMPTSECVESAGFNPDRMIYAYTRVCGSKWTEAVTTNTRRVGLPATLINVGLLKEKEVRLLGCFHEGYVSGDSRYTACPMLYCPKNGKSAQINDNFPISKQVRDFAMVCV